MAIAAATCTTAIARTGRPGITAAPRFITRHRVITRRLATIRHPGITRRLLVITGQALATVVVVPVMAVATGMAVAAATTVEAPVIDRRLPAQDPAEVVEAGMATMAAVLAQADRLEATSVRMATSAVAVMTHPVAGIADPLNQNGALRSAVFYA